MKSRMEGETECKCFGDQGRLSSREGQKTDIMHLCFSFISKVIWRLFYRSTLFHLPRHNSFHVFFSSFKVLKLKNGIT